MTSTRTDTGTPGEVTTWQAGSEPWWARIDRGDLGRTLAVAAAAVLVAVLDAIGAPWPLTVAITVIALVGGCWPILVEAWGDVRSRRMSMELSMLIAIAAAAAIGAWVTALVITVFVLAAEILEDLSVGRGKDALSDLMAFLPPTVQVRDGARLVTVPLDRVSPGQVVVVTPGAGIPVDGAVVAGSSTVDQSRITGESLPVDVAPGACVYAGSVNQTGALEVRAQRVGADSSYGQIIETVRAAQSSQAPAQRLADRLAAWLVYLALAGAILTFVFTRDLRATISVVIVAGACGIAAGTPLAVLAAIGRSARSGAFIKAGTHLEHLSAIDTVVFDKTGTLTTGVLRVTGVHPAAGVNPDKLLALAAAAEGYSEHPIGQAIREHAADRHLPVAPATCVDYQPGYGLTATVHGHKVTIGNTRVVPDANPGLDERAGTLVHVAVDGRYVGSLQVADRVRDTAAPCVADLRSLGLRVVMLTGDHAETAAAIAEQVGITDVRSQLLPVDKLAAVRAEEQAGHRVAMVGDGVNDAPALAEASVGIAMGTGTVIAQETADVVLISADLTDLTRTVRTARRARRIVMTNFAGTIVVDLIGMALAGLGLIGPVAAAIIHVGSESAFILNSARLIPARPTTRDAIGPVPKTSAAAGPRSTGSRAATGEP